MRLLLALVLLPEIASGEPSELAPQLQIDGGLSVIGAGYEQPILDRLSLGIETFVFGTYFLPWFDLGEDVKGVGAGLRPTWFARASGRGLYVAPYFRAMMVDEESITGADGFAISTGVFVGWAFGLTEKLDLRVGGGVQYIRASVDDRAISFGTPFVAIDAVLGYRL